MSFVGEEEVRMRGKPIIFDPEALSAFYLLRQLRERDIDPLPRTDEKGSE